jgi:hypothetical protein
MTCCHAERPFLARKAVDRLNVAGIRRSRYPETDDGLKFRERVARPPG